MSKKWTGNVPETDDFGDEITEEFIDGATRRGPWAIMTPKSWRVHGFKKLGTGRGQRYQRKNDEWIKVEG